MGGFACRVIIVFLYVCVALVGKGSVCRADDGVIAASQDQPSIETILKKYGPVPRPEHPRPDRRRSNWCNLNGVWEFAFDPQDVGVREKWYEDHAMSGRIVVPFCPESELSGLGDVGIHPVCWYAKTFDLPNQLRSGRVLLHLGAVDYCAKLWLNGEYLGSHKGGYDPLEYEATKILRPTGNRLVIRVHDDPFDDMKPRGKQAVQPKGTFYMRTTGIWQTVWLERVGTTFIRDWTIHADPNKAEASLDIQLDGADDGIRAVASARHEGKEVASTSAPSSDGRAKLTIRIPSVKIWTPERPALYDLDLVLQAVDGSVVDRVATYTGFRSIEIRNGRYYYLNGKPFFLISALDQGYYPDGIYTAPTDAALRADVEWAKRFGLNNIRKHQIVADPRYLYWCDRLGMTVWGEMADWWYSALDVDQFLAEWRRCVRRDINHPCIITWVPTNEFRSYDNELMHNIKVRVYNATKRLDPTRPVIDTSGYSHAKTDIVDLHVNPGDWAQWWSKWHETIDIGDNLQLHDKERWVFTKQSRYEGQPIIISEMGLWRIKQFKPLKAIWGTSSSGFDTAEKYLDCYRKNVLAMTADPACAGFSYVQLYDVEGETNGYLTYDRRPKIAPEAISAVHAEIIQNRCAKPSGLDNQANGEENTAE